MAEKRLHIVIDREGHFDVEATGFASDGCRHTVEAIASAVDSTMTQDEDRDAGQGDALGFVNI